MENVITLPEAPSRLSRVAGQDLELCFQCAKCTAGCPVAAEMDIPPHRVVALLRLGQEELLRQAESVWLCVGCGTCRLRCPNGIDIAELLDGLREKGDESPPIGSVRDIARFHRLFVEHIRRRGRVYELGLLARYKLASGGVLGDVPLALRLLRRGKISLLPSRPLSGKGQGLWSRLARFWSGGTRSHWQAASPPVAEEGKSH